MVDKFELLERVALGENDNYFAQAYWMHFPRLDLNSDHLSRAHINFSRKVDPLFLKFSFNSRYSILDYGGQIVDYVPETGSATLDRYPLDIYKGWDNLPLRQELGKVELDSLEALRLTTRELKDTPVIATVFSPLMTLSKIAYKRDLIEESKHTRFNEILENVTKRTIDFAKQAIENGAHGLFVASQHLTKDALPDKQRITWEYNKLKEFAKLGEVSILHVHGLNALVTEASALPFNFVNWHDQDESNPTMDEVATHSKLGLIGGLAEEWLPNWDINDLITHAKSLSQHDFSSRFVFGPGCVLPPDTPLDKLIKLSRALSR